MNEFIGKYIAESAVRRSSLIGGSGPLGAYFEGCVFSLALSISPLLSVCHESTLLPPDLVYNISALEPKDHGADASEALSQNRCLLLSVVCIRCSLPAMENCLILYVL